MTNQKQQNQEPSAIFQYLATLVVNIIVMTAGVGSGWPSPNLPLLNSNNTPYPSITIGVDEGSTIAAIPCIGGMIGNLVFGYVSSRYGRKQSLLIVAIPNIVSWFLLMIAKNVYYLYAARLLNGFCGGAAFVIVPLFLSEIVIDRIRGVLGSTLIFSFNFGILLAFTLGAYCDYFTTPVFVIISTCIFTVAFYYFPESPSFLMKQNNVSEAERSTRFYQNTPEKEKEYELLQLEQKKIQSSVEYVETEECPEEYAEKSLKIIEGESGLKLSDFKAKETLKAFIIGSALAALTNLCGAYAMLNYTSTIFSAAGSSMEPNLSAIFVGIVQLIGSYVPTVLVERTGRKLLYVVSTIGTAFGLITLGTYMLLKSQNYDVESFNWIPIASFSFVIFIASFAVLTLPFLVISEIMPDKLKDFGITFCTVVMWVTSFLSIKFMPLLSAMLGMHGVFFAFSGVCIAATIFILIFLPETKGRTNQEILELLR